MALHLGVGGAEKAITSQANLLCENFDVEILSAYKLYDQPHFRVDPRVKITYLTEAKPNKERLKQAIKEKKPVAILREGLFALKILYLRTASMKKAIKKTNCDIAISTRYLYHHLLKEFSNQKTVTIAQEHNHHNNDQKYIKKIIHSLKYADYFMPVSQELTDFYQFQLKEQHTKCKYIPHCLDEFPKVCSDLTAHKIISIGRLSAEKGFNDLIDIFAQFHSKYADWILDIIGDGEQKQFLQQKISAHGLKESVTLHGYQNQDYINRLLQQSSVYAMTSHTESFGLVLIEAQSFGVPCIAFDSAQGAAEIIANHENGLLIPNRDTAAYLDALCTLAADKTQRLRLGQNARKNAAKYHPDTVKKMWIDFMKEITA